MGCFLLGIDIRGFHVGLRMSLARRLRHRGYLSLGFGTPGQKRGVGLGVGRSGPEEGILSTPDILTDQGSPGSCRSG